MVRLFGKKKDEFPELGATLGGRGVPGPASDSFAQPGLGAGFPEMPSATPSASPTVSSEHIETISKNIELLSSKMDALKAAIDSLSQRMINIESGMKQQPPVQPTQQQGYGQTYAQPPAAPTPPPQEDQGWHY